MKFDKVIEMLDIKRKDLYLHNSRTLILQAPPGQKRTPERIPMKYSARESSSSMASAREKQRVKQVKMRQDQKESQTICYYGKQLFDVAVVNSKSRVSSGKDTRLPTLPAWSDTKVRVPSYVEPKKPTYVYENTGPTKHGSASSVGNTKLYSTMRSRSASEPPMKYRHDRSSPSSAIRSRLSMTNNDYKVISPCPTPVSSLGNFSILSSSHTQPYSDCFLVPLTPLIPESVEDETESQTMEIPEGDQLEELLDIQNGTLETAQDSTVPRINLDTDPTPPSQSAPIVVVENNDDDSGIGEKEEDQEDDKKVKEPEVIPAQRLLSAQKTTRRAPSSTRSRSRKRSGKSDRSRKKDASVGSVCSRRSNKSQKKTEQQVESPEVKVTVVNLEEIEDKGMTLPDLICPSSMEKSREAAVREWLTKTSFPCALRVSPLM